MNLNHLNKIVDQLVSETDIDYDRETVFAPTLLFLPLSLSPLPLSLFLYLSLLPFLPYLFFDHCRDMYGLTKKETIYVWKQYKSIIEDKIKNKPLNESYFDNINNPQQHKFFNRIADDLMDSIEEIINIQHDDEPLELLLNMGNVDHPHEGFYLHTPGVPVSGTDDFTYELFKKIMDNYTMDILNTIQNKWGLDRMDGLFIIIYFFLPKLWNKYYKQDKPSQSLIYSPSPLNESTGDNYLDKVVNQLVDETRIESNGFYTSFLPPSLPYFPLSSLSSPLSLFLSFFSSHCEKIYGLTDEEIQYVWSIYRNIIKDKIENVDQDPLNESVENNYLGRIVSHLVDETIINYEGGTPYISNFPDSAFSSFYLPHKSTHSKMGPQHAFTGMYNSLWRHCRNVYGLTDPEILKVWGMYKKEILNKIRSENELIK